MREKLAGPSPAHSLAGRIVAFVTGATPPFADHAGIRYLFALTLSAVAFSLTVLTWSNVGQGSVSLFFIAVVVSAWFGGFGPALLAISVYFAAESFILAEPRYKFELKGDTVISLAVEAGAAAIVSWLAATRRRAYDESVVARRQAEEAQRELRQMNQQKDEFLGFLSHEIRSPLSVVSGAAAVLRRRAYTLDDQAQAELLDDIGSNADRIQSVLDDLLALARAELGMHPEAEPVLIAQLARTEVEDIVKTRPQRPVHIHGDERRVIVPAVPGYVRQILKNLIGNADKYSPPDSPVDVIIEQQGAVARISVLDRGPGVPSEELETIFDRFNRRHETSTLPGSGLGLTVCRRLVEAQQGRIWAEPREGGGLSVTFTLPAMDDQWLESLDEAPPPAPVIVLTPTHEFEVPAKNAP